MERRVVSQKSTCHRLKHVDKFYWPHDLSVANLLRGPKLTQPTRLGILVCAMRMSQEDDVASSSQSAQIDHHATRPSLAGTAYTHPLGCLSSLAPTLTDRFPTGSWSVSLPGWNPDNSPKTTKTHFFWSLHSPGSFLTLCCIATAEENQVSHGHCLLLSKV